MDQEYQNRKIVQRRQNGNETRAPRQDYGMTRQELDRIIGKQIQERLEVQAELSDKVKITKP